MTSSELVLGVRAEASCRLLNRTLGFHRLQVVAVPGASTSTRLAPPVLDAVQARRQATLLRMISITEAYCVDRLLDLAEVDVEPSGGSIRSQVWEKASTSAVSTWPSMQQAYQSWIQIKPGWTAINRLLEVRNAIAHGLGQLTRAQRNKMASTVGKITAAGIALRGDQVVLEEDDLLRAKNVCVDLISEVDSLVQTTTGDVS